MAGDDTRGSAASPGIFATVVVYKVQPGETASLQTLLSAAASVEGTGVRLRIAVADNTPGGQDPGPLPAGVLYQVYPENPGLARPYNEALATAEREGFDWLLTLDQDTHLPPDFLVVLQEEIARYRDTPEVAAIVPHVIDGARPISPLRFKGGFLPVVLPVTANGIAGPHTSAINSASLLRVRDLLAVGGYDEEFPLHNSDTRLFQKLDRAGKRLAIAGDLTVAHELSILRRAERISPERYRAMLEDECFFWDRHMSLAGRMERWVRLAGRAAKSVLQREDPAFLRITLGEMRRRLVLSRTRRLNARADQP